MDTPFHILVADDEPQLLSTMSILLRSAGYEVSTASTGLEAWTLIQGCSKSDHPVDILITDIQMPDMTGDELIETIRRHDLDVTVLAITGFGTKDLVIDLMRKGCSEYIDKPFKGTDLLSRVESLTMRIKLHRAKLATSARDLEERQALVARELDQYRAAFDRVRSSMDKAVGAWHDLVRIDRENLKIPLFCRMHAIAELGGDFAAAINAGDGVDILVADVAGHDAGASYHTILIKAFFEENARRGHSGAEFFTLLNRALVESGVQRMVTAVFAHVDLARNQVSTCSAGHVPVSLLPAGLGVLTPLYTAGPVLGIFDEVDFDTLVTPCAPGDRLIMYTDGLTSLCRIDGPTGQKLRMSPAGIDRILLQKCGESLESMSESVWTAAMEFGRHTPDDDVTLLIAGIPGR